MPYIRPNEREYFDADLSSLIERFADASPGQRNYVITRLCAGVLDQANYNEINELIGVLECAKLELYRRVAAPYEDKKKGENGDVY